MHKALRFVIVLALLSSCNNQDHPAPGPDTSSGDKTPPLINYNVVRSYPHDTTSYTEGLVFHDGQLYEATGTEPDFPPSRRSLFGVVDLHTGKIDKKVELDRKKFFGEGISFLNGKVYQLTYKTKTGYVYESATFKKLDEFTFPSVEGWGMTSDSTHLIMSDGSSNITWLDPTSSTPVQAKVVYNDKDSVVKTMKTFKLVRILGVTDNNGPVSNINELELIHGFLYANQWTTNYILKIDPSSGKVVGRLDLTSIANEARNKFPGSDTMNGIAYDAATGKVFVTGKLWPNIYEIKFPF